MRKLGIFFRLPFRRQWLLSEAAIGLTVFKILTATLPFSWIAKRLGKQVDAATPDSPNIPETLYEIRWAIRTAGQNLPWGRKCLVQAIAGKWMAKRRGHICVLHLGTKRHETRKYKFHAWLTFHDFPITGGSKNERYSKLANLQ